MGHKLALRILSEVNDILSNWERNITSLPEEVCGFKSTSRLEDETIIRDECAVVMFFPETQKGIWDMHIWVLQRSKTGFPQLSA